VQPQPEHAEERLQEIGAPDDGLHCLRAGRENGCEQARGERGRPAAQSEHQDGANGPVEDGVGEMKAARPHRPEPRIGEQGCLRKRPPGAGFVRSPIIVAQHGAETPLERRISLDGAVIVGDEPGGQGARERRHSQDAGQQRSPRRRGQRSPPINRATLARSSGSS